MARKVGPDGPKLQIREKNGRYYAYRSTSRMVDGKKKTVNEFVGRYDPETETVIPKTPMRPRSETRRAREEMNPSIDFSKVGTRSYGGVYLLHNIQRRIHLGLDLQRSFGLSARAILSCAMALAINPGPFSSIESTFDSVYIRDLYGTEIRTGSEDLSALTRNIGKADVCIDEFFGCRIRRCGGLVAWDTTTHGTHSDLDGMAEWAPNKDGDGLRVVKKGMATDMRGIPLMFRFYPGSLSDMATVDRMQEDIERYGRDDALFVMDRGFCSGANIHGMLERGRRFVVPAKTDFKAISRLLTLFGGSVPKETMVHNGHAFTVWRAEVGLREADRLLVDGSRAYEFTCDGFEGHCSAGRLTAYVCYDSEKYSDEVQTRELIIDSLREYARNMDEADPVRAFRKHAGKAVRYFDVEPDGRKVTLRLRTKARTRHENRAGTFVMLCSGDIPWEIMMAAYDARRLTEQAFDTEKSCDRRLRTGSRVTLQGRYMIQFVAQMLLAEIRATIRECDRDATYTTEGVLATLSTLNVMEYGGQRGLSEVTRNVRRVLGMFGIEVPKEPIYHGDMFDPMLLLPDDVPEEAGE